MTQQFPKEFIHECRTRLLAAKSELLNRARLAQWEFEALDRRGGDEADQTVFTLHENEFLTNQERLRSRLLEIELALERIEKGVFGICEETQEPIARERLRALPWTRVSLEGAEFREAQKRRNVR